jgi:3-deoxy-D-manno-octulosonic-acid transferase
VRTIYSIIFYLALPLIVLRLLLRSRKAPAYRQRIMERFGFVRPLIDSKCIWVHAVSVGETLAAKPLIARLQQTYPQHTIVVTTMTPTGAERVADIKGNVQHRYAPYDTPGAVKRFIRRIKPEMLIIMETEIWPNTLHCCRKNNIPSMLVNARMSEKSANGYANFKTLVGQALRNITHIAAQTGDDEERLIMLGADPSHVTVTGSLKFDFEPPANIYEQAAELRKQWGVDRKVWIAASTHQGEDDLVLQAYDQIKQALPESLLILVPRHPERFKQVTEQCRARGMFVTLRSEHLPCEARTDVFIGDTMGELMLFYAAADIAFVGGSFVPTGGHNLLEPASLGKPVLTGPHMFNFAEIHRLLIQGEASIEVETPHHLASEVIALFKSPEQRKEMGENGRRLVQQNRGALDKVVRLIAQLKSAA